MEQAYYINRHEERDGQIVLFNRPNGQKPIWHMRLYVKGMKNANGVKKQYVQKSTSTTDKAEAIAIAKEEHDSLRYKVRHKKPATDIRFKDLYVLWWSTKKRRALEKRFESKGREGKNPRITWHERFSERYWIPYFGEYLVNDIDNTIIENYWRWREEYWYNASDEDKKKYPNHSLNPAKKTLAMEQSTLRELFGWAHSEKIKEYMPIVATPYNRDGVAEKRRPSFEREEWERLDRYMRERWVKGKGINDAKSKKVHKGHLWQREMVRLYIQFLQSTGMRPGEPLRLRHRDISVIKTKKGSEVLKIQVPRETKTGERDVHSMKTTVRYYNSIKEHTGYNKPDDWVFCDRSGVRSRGYYATVKSLLRELDMYLDKNNDKRSSYSFRHYYAEQRLQEIGTNPQALDYIAANMGTSWQMLQNFYIRKGQNVDLDTLIGFD